MAECLLALCFMMLKLVIVLAKTPTTLNETCVDDIGFALQFNIYEESCPQAEAIIFSWVETAISRDPRMAASLLRLHFHDCFVNGCDASVLLDDSGNFVGEKTAPPNLNSLRGFEVIDAIKSELESVCPETVSCADILAIVARDSVVLSGGPSWEVQMGRRDSVIASKAAASANIPAPNSTVATLLANFQNVGLTLNDMVALSGLIGLYNAVGAHTIGKARCPTFASRIQGKGNLNSQDANLEFIESLQQLCSEPESNSKATNLDLGTPAKFDNQYYINLLSGEGLLPSDQALVTDNDQSRRIIESYAQDPFLFFQDFKYSMLKMGNLGPLTGTNGEIRNNCRAVN